MTTWLITGCSSGLGRSLAQAVLEVGLNAVVTARDPQTLQDLVAAHPDNAASVALDVTNKAQVESAVKLAEERFGSVDVLVNNAGHGYRAAIEEGEEQAVADLFATNFFGGVSMIKAVLPGMRARRRGTILNVSSIGVWMGGPGSGYYAATKFALEGISDSLRAEVEPLGIRVMVVEPGAFRTDFAGRSLQGAKTAIADYDSTAGPRRKENDKTHGTQPGDPARAAHAIIKAVEGKGTVLPSRLLLGSDAVKIVSQAFDTQRQAIEDWKELSTSTDFEAEG